MFRCTLLLLSITGTCLILTSQTTAEYIRDLEEGLLKLRNAGHSDQEQTWTSTLSLQPPSLTSLKDVASLTSLSSLTDAVTKLQEVLASPNDTHSEFTDVSPTCINDTGTILVSLLQRKPWTSPLLDSIGKLPSGILKGNFKWLGSYDECITVPVPDGLFQTQYCLSNVPISGLAALLGNGTNGADSPSLFGLLGGKPKIAIGLCVPRSCNAKDTAGLVNTLLFVMKVNLTQEHVSSTDVLCQEEDRQLDDTAIAAIVVSSIILFVVLLGTLYDVMIYQPSINTSILPPPHSNGVIKSANTSKLTVDEYTPLVRPEEKVKEMGMLSKILLSFSVYTNGSKLLSTKQNAGALTCVNGIRFISMTWVILGHTFAFVMTSSENTLSYTRKVFSRWTYMAVANAFFSVDTFFVLSGLLLTYLTMKELEKKGICINWGMFYFHRFWRLTPPYMLCMLIYVGTFKYWASGPVWPGETEPFCKDYWWTNLLYINNLVEPTKMCFGWSWYLANDMQFFVISPIFLILLCWSWLAGGLALMATLLVSLIVSGAVSSHYNVLPALIGGGGSEPLTSPFMLLYIRPWTRIGPYLVGMATGYILYKTKCQKRINWFLALVGWALASLCCLSTLYGVYDTYQGNPPSTDVSALYNSLSRTVWAAGVCWVIYACSIGYGGFVNTILSWDAFVPLGRLTYMAYLIHPPIIYLCYYSRETLFYMDDLTSIYLFVGHVVLAYGGAFICSLVLEAPMLGLEKVILKRNR